MKFTLVAILMCFTSAGSFAAPPMNTQPQDSVQIFVKESGPGKTFAEILKEAGFEIHDANKLLIDPIIPEKLHLNPKEKYLVLHDKARHHVEVRIYLDYTDEALVFSDDAGHVKVEKKTIPFKVVLKTYEGKVRGSLIESIKHLVPDEWAAFRFSDAFSWDINVGKQLVQNDSFKFTIEEMYDEDKFVKYGEITDAWLTTKGVTINRVLWEDKDTKVFVDPSTRFADRPFYAPLDYIHVSSIFTRRRLHPVRHNYQPHLGVDLAWMEGAPVYATREGVIGEATHHHASGNFISIKHDGGFISIYDHLDGFAPGIAVGKHVETGDVIGYVGCTGYCTSPHLHFGIRKGDYLYDPMLLTKPYPYKERNYWETDKFKGLVGSNGAATTAVAPPTSDSKNE